MTVSHHKNQWRMSDRIKLPAWVIIDNQRYDLIDWSFAGFAIASQTEFKVGDVVELTLTMPFEHHTAQCNLHAEVRIQDARSAVFEFVDIPQSVRLMMREYVENFVEGQLDGTEAHTSRSSRAAQDVRVTESLAAKKDAVAPVQKHAPKFWQKLVLYSLFTAFGLFVIAGLLVSQRYVNSTQAGLVGNTVEVRSRVEGYVKEISVKAGDVVKAGQLLVQLEDREFRRNLRAGAYVQQLAQEAMGTAKKALQDEKLEGKLFSRIAKYRSESENARLKETDAQLAQVKAELDRTEMLVKSGFVAKAVLDDRKFVYAEKVASLNRVSAEAAMSVDVAREADVGRFFSSTQIANRSTDLIQVMERRKNEHAQALLQLAPLFTAVENSSLITPNNGTIRIITRAPGELVRAGELVAVVETNQLPSVMAKFTVADAYRISPGQNARIFFPALDQVFDGIVEAVGPQGLITDAGLANTTEPGKNEVPVAVRFTSPPTLPSGLRAKVEIDTNQNVLTQIRQRLR